TRRPAGPAPPPPPPPTTTTTTTTTPPKKKKTFSLRDTFVRSDLDLVLLGLFLAVRTAAASSSLRSPSSPRDDDPTLDPTDDADAPHLLGNYLADRGAAELDEAGTDPDPTLALLYPWFTQTLSVLIYYVLSRHLPVLPYPAVVFVLGFALGYVTDRHSEDAISQSSLLWMKINWQVLLNVFLPGLIFLDSYEIDVHLFFQAFWQLMNFAFPMVLGGTVLTALVARFIFPYGWSFNLCMTFGAILSGTDPVAVSGLLDSLGAPPRLKMHVSGESLLNDGSAMVFYMIFSDRFFFELGVPGLGEDIGWGAGFVLFFRLAFGGAAVGLAFGLGTVVLLGALNRRLAVEERVMQVVVLISVAYLTYFTADVLCVTSGIIATIAFGLTVKVLGGSMIHDDELTRHFLEVTGQLLNTLLFILGGTLWGNIISNNDALDRYHGIFGGMDWAYLAILFVMLIVIRFVLVFGVYPITRHTGVGTNWKETVFMAYGGFRGSVGIALALSLHQRLYCERDKSTDPDEFIAYQNELGTLFCMVGGISLFTLLINGITSKPLLQLLSLVTPEQTRQKVVLHYRKEMAQVSTWRVYFFHALLTRVLVGHPAPNSMNIFNSKDWKVIYACSRKKGKRNKLGRMMGWLFNLCRELLTI
ncbi:hypothetical protein ACHAWF_008919, partial [Thalassiosira exigua]